MISSLHRLHQRFPTNSQITEIPTHLAQDHTETNQDPRHAQVGQTVAASMGNAPMECPQCDGTGKITVKEEVQIWTLRMCLFVVASALPCILIAIAAATNWVQFGSPDFDSVVKNNSVFCCSWVASWVLVAVYAVIPGTVTFAHEPMCCCCNGKGEVRSDMVSRWDRKTGTIMKMYHGTRPENVQSIMKHGFKPSSDGMLGRGVYLSSNIRKARRYGRAIFVVWVKLGKTKAIDSQNHPMRTSWSRYYDSAWVPANCGMTPSGLTETCVFDPDRIRIISRP